MATNEPLIESLLGEDYFTKPGLARFLHRGKRTIDRMHSERTGPPRTVIGRTILYRKAAVLDWLKSKEQHQPRARASRRAA